MKQLNFQSFKQIFAGILRDKTMKGKMYILKYNDYTILVKIKKSKSQKVITLII